MLVTLERGGGVTGARNHQRLGPLDTEARDDGTKIEKLVADADFFEFEDDFPRTRGRSDPTWHTVRVVDGDADRTIRWDDNQPIPDALTALRDACSSLGGWQPVQ
ncbi:MAG: hypothetical protein ACT4PI_12880 [Actinomycetota bacterium]